MWLEVWRLTNKVKSRNVYQVSKGKRALDTFRFFAFTKHMVCTDLKKMYYIHQKSALDVQCGHGVCGLSSNDRF